jgi:iron complex outermembrane recepter protein
MSVRWNAAGQTLLAAPGRLALSAPLATAAADSPTVTYPFAIAGLSGWWDAGATTGMVDPTGAAVTAFGASVGVGRHDPRAGCRRRADRQSRGHHGAGCHATVERCAGRARPQPAVVTDRLSTKPSSTISNPPGTSWVRSAIRRQLASGLLAAALIALAHTGHAQRLEDLQNLSIEQLGNIEITSVSKTTEQLSDAPAAIYVISHDDIIRSGATTIPEMLQLAPNLEVAQINASTYAISARGFNVGDNASLSNKLLVLIDGRSVYTPMFGGVYWDMQEVLPDDIDRIEVISGPGAALWGANAVNGVVNIITRKSGETQGGVLTLGAGNLERDISLQYGGRLAPDLTYRVHTEFSDFSAYQQSNGQTAQDGWSKPQGGFRVDWTPANDSVSVQGDIFDASDQPTGTVAGRDLVANWQHKFTDGSSLQLLAYYDDAERYSDDDNGGLAVNTYDVELQHNFSLLGWNNIVWGAGERAYGYTFENTPGLQLVPSHQTLNLANIFAQDTISLPARVKLTLGVKVEDEPYAGVQVMPSVRIAWKLADPALLWAAVSRAVRSPTPVDDDLREFIGPIDFLNGSTAFRPETLTAFEIGTREQMSSRASFSVSTYYDEYDNLRSIDPSSTLIPLQFGNMMAGDVLGVEVWGNYQPTDWWRLSAGFDLQHENLRFLPGSLTAAGLAFVADDPGHQASLHSAVNLGHGVTWDAYLRDVGMLPHPSTPEYVELNTRLGWDITPSVQVSLSGLNLLHARHVEFVEPGISTEVPRSIYAQARFRF